MAIKTEEIAVNTTAVLVASAQPTVQDKATVLINGISGACWLGGPDVTNANGLPVTDTTVGIAMELGPGDELWAISDAAQTLRVLVTRS